MDPEDTGTDERLSSSEKPHLRGALEVILDGVQEFVVVRSK